MARVCLKPCSCGGNVWNDDRTCDKCGKVYELDDYIRLGINNG